MPKENITSFNFRLNLDNEQHLRVYKIFHNLNVDIHKSKNQFIVDALDFYIRSFEEEDFSLMKKTQRQIRKRLQNDGEGKAIDHRGKATHRLVG